MNKKLIITLIIFSVIALFLNVYQKNITPPCFNVDEAAFGYNAYSLATTARDEYGKMFPLRLKSFGDNKMPLYSYLSAPLIAIFGLNEASTRSLNLIIAVLFPLAVFGLCNALLNNKRVSVIAAFLVVTSLGLNLIGRHAHEAYISAFLTTLSATFLIKYLKHPKIMNLLIFFTTLTLLLFSYHPGRLYALFFFAAAMIYSLINKKPHYKFLFGFALIIGLFFITDIIYSPTRLNNLLFFKSQGFESKINELKTEGGLTYLYNPITIGLKDGVIRYFSYLSPEFLLVKGDENPRFGFPEMSILTPIEYIFIFIGIYYLFYKKEPYRFYLLGLFLIAPVTASLSWADFSLTRSLFLLIPSLIITAYGVISVFRSKHLFWLLIIVVLTESYFLLINWDFYLNHYAKRALIIRSWQCGNREMADYLKENYNRFDRFYITRKNSQPYIFPLFYFPVKPALYQKQASLSAPDEFGFGQVEKFDKFIFHFQMPAINEKAVAIGYPDDFPDAIKNNQNLIKKIKLQNEEIFWIYENQ